EPSARLVSRTAGRKDKCRVTSDVTHAGVDLGEGDPQRRHGERLRGAHGPVTSHDRHIDRAG
ncbi:MAG: hypothetical protein ABUL56_00695, partial [Actinomycetota bacterium]